jgi:Bacterial Ig domain
MLLLGGILCACAPGIGDGSVGSGAAGGNDAGNLAEAGPDAGSDGMQPSPRLPVVTIDHPTEGQVLAAASLHIEGTASDDDGIASVFVRVGPNVPRLANTDDGFHTWHLDATSPYGSFVVEAAAYDVGGTASDPPARVRVSRSGGPSDSAAPTISISTPSDGDRPTSEIVLVQGTASDDVGVVRMELVRNGELLVERSIETDDFYAHWARLVPLLPGEDNTLTFRAYDELGHVGEATIHLSARPDVDRDPPLIEVTSHKAGQHVDADVLPLVGTAFDRIGVREVKVRVGTLLPGTTELRWGDATAAVTTDGFAHWKASIAIPMGPFAIEAKAIDVHGLAARQELALVSDFVAEWGPERVVPLRLRDGEPRSAVDMSLDRTGVNEVIAPDIQKDILLLELDPNPLLQSSLEAIKLACGTGWRADDPNPHHDCSLTELGRTFRGPDGTWKTSTEYSMVRILTMTPANVVVDGTSIEGLKNIADGAILGIKIGGGFNQVLAETLGIPRTQEIVPTPALAHSLRQRWLAVHPNIRSDGRLPVMLYDAMHDLEPLGTRFGPAGNHPGVLDPASPPHGVVFGPDFRMTLKAISNLRWLDGVVLAQGKDYMATVVDQTGPTYDDVMEFDFQDPARFQVDGLVAAPTVDMRLKMLDDPAFIASCNGSDICQKNLPGTPVGTSSIWAIPTYHVESIVAGGALEQYRTRTYDHCYVDFLGCLARVSVGSGGAPAGWLHFEVLFDLGNPPRDQYLWEQITEVAQVALHHIPGTTIAEGDADVGFTLRDVPVGITADEIRTAIRPYLSSQASQISSRLLGDYAKNNGQVDFVYRRGRDGLPYLFFADATDPRPHAGSGYAHAGFFRDTSFADASRESSLNLSGSGDSTHQKLAVVPGDSVTYVEDEAGGIYRLKLHVPPDPTEITVGVARKVR